MLGFLIEDQPHREQETVGDVGQFRGGFRTVQRFANFSPFVTTRFPVFFPRFFEFPQPYPPYPTPSLTVELRYDSSTSGPITTTSPALLSALSILNASPGPVQVTLVANGQVVFSGSVAVAAPTGAIQALRGGQPQFPSYPYGAPFPYVMPYFRGGFVLGAEDQSSAQP